MTLDIPIANSRLRAIRDGAVLVPDQPAIFAIEGTGALTCLQGLLTSDLVTAGEPSLSYGGLLTPKGMIVSDLWVLREGEKFLLSFPRQAREAVTALLGRTLPPRLARVTDRSESHSALHLLGASAGDRSAGIMSGVAPPVSTAPAPGQAPFRAIAIGPFAEIDSLAGELLGAGLAPGTSADLAASMILAGWPALGREIDEKTLPQEVRFEENGGVSYTKGCYTGQETVARIHFRGHVNRTLRGLVVDRTDIPGDRTLRVADREVGSLRSALLLEDRVVGLALVRREVEDGGVVGLGTAQARVVPLPMANQVLAL